MKFKNGFPADSAHPRFQYLAPIVVRDKEHGTVLRFEDRTSANNFILLALEVIK